MEPCSGWVVTWFSFGYTAPMFEYTVWIFWSNVSVFSSIPQKYTIFQHIFSRIKLYQDIPHKASYFKYGLCQKENNCHPYSLFQAQSLPLKNLWESVLKVRIFMRDILAWLDWGNVGWKMVYNFLGNNEKHGEISIYFRLKHHCGKEVWHFSVQCIQTNPKWLPTLML